MWTKNLLEYCRICDENQNNIPLFFQPWWLNAVSRGARWQPFVHLPSSAVWPVFVRHKWGILPYSTLPPLTPRLGWWLPDAGNLPAEPPPSRYFWGRQRFSGGLGLEGYLQRFGHTAVQRHYYKIPAPFTYEQWMDSCSVLSKRQIKKAEQQLVLQENADVRTLHYLMGRSLSRHGMGAAVPLQTVERAANAADAQGCARIWAALDRNGRTHAAVMLAWDAHTVYYIAGGMDERIEQAGGPRWLLAKGIKMATDQGKSFELGGGSDPGVGRLYASLGAQTENYWECRGF